MKKPGSGFILPHGNYRELLSYKKARVVFDVTFAFCGRFLTKGDRTIGQMIQAARSGKQNILEGSKASGTSKETEIKLTNTARASLEELLDDYQDFLRTRKCRLWEKGSREASFGRRLAAKAEPTYEDFRQFCETRTGEVVANIAICLIHQTNYLLDRQIRRQERDFINEGGFRERMRSIRLQQRRTKANRKPTGRPNK
jgi:four helix bundle suffix protein